MVHNPIDTMNLYMQEIARFPLLCRPVRRKFYKDDTV